LNRKRTALAVIVERRKGRKQFCAFSARARRSRRFFIPTPNGKTACKAENAAAYYILALPKKEADTAAA
jgi:hypothetical protein